MVDRVATYLVEVYGADEALEFATRAVAENRAHGRPECGRVGSDGTAALSAI